MQRTEKPSEEEVALEKEAALEAKQAAITERNTVVDDVKCGMCGLIVEDLWAITVQHVSKSDEFCIKNEELCINNYEFCIKNEEFCHKNEEFRIQNDEFCRRCGARRKSNVIISLSF